MIASRITIALAIAAPALFSRGASAAGVRDLFAEGNALYREAAAQDGQQRQATYLAAARRYAEAASMTQNAYVFYNLGNALYRAGRPGQAIAAYLRAELLAPRHVALQRNLALARDAAAGGGVAPRPHPAAAAFFFWHYALSLAEVETLAAVFFAICMAALAARLFVGGAWPRRLRLAAVASGCLAAAFALSAAAKLGSSERDGAVVISAQTSVRSEPAGRAVELHVLREGAEVRVLKRDGDWTRVEWGANTRGWIESQALEFLSGAPRPPEWPAMSTLDSGRGQ